MCCTFGLCGASSWPAWLPRTFDEGRLEEASAVKWSVTDQSLVPCRGIPVYVFEIRHLDSKTVAQYEKTSAAAISKAPTDGTTRPKLLRLFALYENLTRFVHPLGTELTDREHPNTPITMSTNIVDVSGVSLRMFWNLKGHMQAASHLATAHYPETLDRIFVGGGLTIPAA